MGVPEGELDAMGVALGEGEGVGEAGGVLEGDGVLLGVPLGVRDGAGDREALVEGVSVVVADVDPDPVQVREGELVGESLAVGVRLVEGVGLEGGVPVELAEGDSDGGDGLLDALPLSDPDGDAAADIEDEGDIRSEGDGVRVGLADSEGVGVVELSVTAPAEQAHSQHVSATMLRTRRGPGSQPLRAPRGIQMQWEGFEQGARWARGDGRHTQVAPTAGRAGGV